MASTRLLCPAFKTAVGPKVVCFELRDYSEMKCREKYEALSEVLFFTNFVFGGMAEEEEMAEERESVQSGDDASLDEEAVRRERRREKKRKRLLKEAEKAEKRGVCYLSRVPPHMNPLRLRQILSQYGEIGRVYLTPEDPANQMRRKKSGGFRGQEFSEGWVEFIDKKVAKRVASMLNGEQIGGKKRSSIYYDLWNIKYLSKFKWDDLKEETEIKNATREQKLVLELSAAKKERDFYLSKVDQSKAISKIGERLKKKRKIEMVPKVVRHFPQKRPFGNETGESKGQLSRDILAGVFGS
ncbi:pre-rRNA-processing protein esf2-like isoform X2 [Salvia miltiorrhiza]|uniref:pre-rRNA-processing protein esf2-like isoform X2 n=1 Tax=Salvia miltiorrhiza TaxID=226208 RepID=UPI0025AC5F35|nr:pre-rRNA-processing protein esf2-like isoform X2 [Salvia miltiorrhiza]